MEIKPGFEKKITEELILKIASTPEEGNFLADFNANIHGDELREYVHRVFTKHPKREEILWFYIEDVTLEQENRIVSSAALLPYRWNMEGTQLKVAELAFVGTEEDYRGQGLFGIIHDFYEEALKEREYVLSILVGVPYYYTRFGYVFSLNRFTGYSMPTNNIPQEQIEDIKIRKANEDDLDQIKKFYNHYNEKYGISSVFDEDLMDFRLMNTTCDLVNSMTYIVEEDRKSKAFFSIGSLDDPNRADIILVSDLSYRQMVKVLQFVKTYNPGNINAFRVNLMPNSNFGRFLASRGGDRLGEWLWQIKIPDLLEFFKAIKPVLEQRIKSSIFANLTQNVSFSNYSDTIILEFIDGKIEEISMKKEFPKSDVDLRIPTPYNIRLFLSDRTVDELQHIISDSLVRSQSKLLIETLFPLQESIPFSWYE